ncbi:acyl-coenzyme A synthetase ACSM5, mitochondrial, partial [Neophocaena asiaeorientalis asiaeorientalis]|uniref:medium-chain acyl-CoA ligase n=1 Tax=Neophocaena asiaeorientalis asiaeorientalis TaxID=1706337 RepID=A0A341BBW8_NEOAA
IWLRGLVLQALRNAWGICVSHGQLPPLPVPQKIVATWEIISLGRQPVPEYFNFAHGVLGVWSQLERAGHRPPIPAFWWVNGMGAEVKGSFEELGGQSRKAANVLGGMCGLQPGDRMLLLLPQLPERGLVSVACMRTGLVFMPGTSQLTAKDILHWLQASKAKCTVASEEVIPAVESIVSECPGLKTKFLLSPHSQNRWLSFQELFQ